MNQELVDELLSAIRDSRPRNGLWSAKTIAEYMDIGNYRQVLDRYAPHPDFPKAIRVPIAGGGRGQPRWKEEEVRAWWEKYKEDSPGRRRARQ